MKRNTEYSQKKSTFWLWRAPALQAW